jgi:hypothetical protein
MCLQVSYKKKIGKKIIFCILFKSLRKGVGSDPEWYPDPLVIGADVNF